MNSAPSRRGQTCEDLEAALGQAVKGGQQVGVARVVAAAQARARRIVPAAAHYRRNVPAGPAANALMSDKNYQA